MSPFLTLLDLRKKQGRIETFVGKLYRNEPFTTKGGKTFYANAVRFLSSDGRELHKAAPQTLIEANKLVQYMRISASASNKIVIFSVGNEGGGIPLTDLKTTGEFGFKGNSYRDSMEDYEVTRCRVSLAKAIAQNLGPITLLIGNVKYYDVCDVISSYSKNSNYKTMADMSFIDRNANPVVWVANNVRDEDRTEQVSRQIIQSSIQCREFVSDITTKYPNGLSSGDSLYRKFSGNSGSMDRLKATYGPYYDGSKRFNEQNVTVYCDGAVNVIKGSANTFRLSASGIRVNGKPLFGVSEPVMLATYNSNKNDFGIPNTEILVDSLQTKTAKLF